MKEKQKLREDIIKRGRDFCLHQTGKTSTALLTAAEAYFASMKEADVVHKDVVSILTASLAVFSRDLPYMNNETSRNMMKIEDIMASFCDYEF